MLPHHLETIRRTTEYFSREPGVTALILGGSLAHGFGSAQSDVDVMIVVSDEDFAERVRTGRTCFFSRELCTYEGGYVDGKFIAPSFLAEVATRGSEPARFAFQDAQVLFAHDASLAARLAAIARYPLADKAERIRRFQAQFEAWTWYTGEALKRQNAYLLHLAVAKLTLFGGRIVLAHNERLYPFHKWFLRVLADAPEKPAGLMEQIDAMTRAPDTETIEQFSRSIREFRAWEVTHATWPARFMQDSEFNWRSGAAPVDDI
jgi:predicted nucleotidyltransferase